jgi:hypothetical protein
MVASLPITTAAWLASLISSALDEAVADEEATASRELRGSKQRRHPDLGFRGSMAGLCPPLPTLRRRPLGRQRTARGRCRCYSFIVVDLHQLLLASLPAHFESSHASQPVQSSTPTERTPLEMPRYRAFPP